MPASVTSLADVSMFASVLRKIEGKSFSCAARNGTAPARHVRRDVVAANGASPRALFLDYALSNRARTRVDVRGPCMARPSIWQPSEVVAIGPDKKARPSQPRLCCGERIRTFDLWVMSPTSYRCSTPQTDSTSNAPQRRTRTIARSATDPRSPHEPTRRSPARPAAPR